MKIIFSPHFERQYRKLPAKIKNQAKSKEKIFRRDVKDPRLKTHKLKGQLGSYWSFSVDYNYRIIFKNAGKDTICFLDIGTHDIYHGK